MAITMKTVRLRGSDYTRYMKNVDGYRQQTQKSLFDEFGPVRIAGPNGRFIKVIRSDPGDAPTVVERNDVTVDQAKADKQAEAMKRMKNSGNATRAPSPKSCKCRNWPLTENETVPVDDRGKPTEHRRTCAFKKMWERQSGGHIKTVAAGPTFEASHHKSGSPRNTSNPQPRLMGKTKDTVKLKNKTEKVPTPYNCTTCKDWKKPKRMDQEQHHEMCPHFKKYKQLAAAQKAAGVKPAPKVEAKQAPLMLFDLEKQEVVREAEADEVIEAKRAMRDESAAIIVIDGKSYLVMYEDGTALEAAAPEPAAEPERDTQPPSPDEEGSEDEEEEPESEEEPAPEAAEEPAAPQAG